MASKQPAPPLANSPFPPMYQNGHVVVTRTPTQSLSKPKRPLVNNGTTLSVKNPFGSPGSDITKLVGKGNVTVPGGVPGTDLSLNVKGLQQMLVKNGYKIKVDGQLGPLTLSALRDYYGQPSQNVGTFEQALGDPQYRTGAGGVGHPSAWNKTHVNVTAPVKPATTHSDGTPGTGQTTAGTSTSGSYSAPSSGGTVNYGNVASLLTNTGQQIPVTLSDFGKMINPKTAQDIANAQFGPQIAAAQLALKEDPVQAAQDLKDISSWYGQVGAAQKSAQQAVRGYGGAGTASIGDAARALASSLGGSANQGASDITASGQNATNTEAALNQAANTYEANIGPLLAAEGAEQKVNQQNKNTAQLLSDRSALAALQSSSGSAANAALAQIIGQNNSLSQARATMLASILQNNNALGQQSFTNQLALENSIAQAQALGLNTAYKQSQINYDNSRANAPAMAVDHPFNYYQQHDPKYIEQVANSAAASLVDKQGNKLPLNPQQAWNVIAGIYGSAGFNPAPGTPSYRAAQNVYSAWANYQGPGA